MSSKPLSNLSHLQSFFQDHLQHDTKEIFTSIIGRMKIYFDAYRLRLVEILMNDFPKCHTLLGDEIFDSAARNYIDLFPSKYFSVRYFGQDFSRFLANTKPYCNHPYLAEMASFEWNLLATLDSANSETLKSEVLFQISAEKLPLIKIKFLPSLRRFHCEWDTPQLWLDIDNLKPERESVRNESPVPWILWRSGLESVFRSLNRDEATAITIFMEGGDFSDMCEGLLDCMEESEIPSFALNCIHHWLEEGIVSEFILPQ